MKIIVDANMLKSLFEDYRRDDYSYEGCEAILDYYNDFDEDAEIDIIAIACDVNEYGNAIGSTLDEDDLVSDYGYLLDDDGEKTFEAVLDALEERTTVIRLRNGNALVFAF